MAIITQNLLPILNQTGLQKDNNRLYQVLQGLITNLHSTEKTIVDVSSSIPSGVVTGHGTAGSIAEWLTSTSLTDVDQSGISSALDLLP